MHVIQKNFARRKYKLMMLIFFCQACLEMKPRMDRASPYVALTILLWVIKKSLKAKPTSDTLRP